MDFINQPISELLSLMWNKLYQFLVWMFISDDVGNDLVYKTYLFAVIFTWIPYTYGCAKKINSLFYRTCQSFCLLFFYCLQL